MCGGNSEAGKIFHDNTSKDALAGVKKLTMNPLIIMVLFANFVNTNRSDDMLLGLFGYKYGDTHAFSRMLRFMCVHSPHLLSENTRALLPHTAHRSAP